MKKFLIGLGLALAIASPASAQITVPNTLTAGEVIRASELNTNFSSIGTKALNRITGGLIEGNVTLNANVTIDGVDLSDFLLTTGEIVTQTAGTVGAPSFTRSGDTSTGLYFPGVSGEVAISLSGVQKLLVNSSGLTVFGVNLVGSDGKIPAISSTYFASLDGSALTALNASNVSSGTLADGRLSSNIPLKDAATNAFTGNATFGGTLGVTGTSTLGTVSAGAMTVTSFTMATGAVNGHVLTSNASGVATWQSPGAATGAVPSGMIAVFDTACPATWTRFTALDNKFIRGGSTYSAVGGGSDTHTHTVDPAATTTTASGGHTPTINAGGSHTHTVDIGVTSTSTDGSHTHDAGTFDTTTAGAHTHTGTTDNSGGDINFDVGDGSLGTISGTGTHNHTFTTASSGDHEHGITGSTGSSGSHSHTVDPASTSTSSDGSHTHTATAVPDHTHSVDIASTSTSSGANVPAYVQVVFCKKD